MLPVSFADWLRADESLSDMAYYQSHGDLRDAVEAIGLDPDSYDRVLGNLQEMGEKAKSALEKVDKLVGVKKSLMLAVPTYRAKIKLLSAVYQLSRHPKKPASWAAVTEAMVELTKLAVMNPILAVPAGVGAAHAVGVEDSDAMAALVSKVVSTSYFYLDTIAGIAKSSKSPEIQRAAESISSLLPKSEILR